LAVNPLPIHQRHAYPRARWIHDAVAQDLALVLALGAILALHPEGPLALALGVAIPATIAWSLLTLHLPSRVDIDHDGIVFSAYGREHRFAWRDIERIHVRRFIVRDRVLVRVAPSTLLRGRYWLIHSIEGYEALVRALERRGVGSG
jgi:hypothetical protein